MCLWCTSVCGTHVFVVCMCMCHFCVCGMQVYVVCMYVTLMCVYVVLMCVVCMPVWCACTSVDMYVEQWQRLTLSASSISLHLTYWFRFSHLNLELAYWCCLMSQFASVFLCLSSKSWNYTWAGKSTKHFGILNSSPYDCKANTLPSGSLPLSQGKLTLRDSSKYTQSKKVTSTIVMN